MLYCRNDWRDYDRNAWKHGRSSFWIKLTLSVDEQVVRAAKRYAAARGTSVSRLVERYLGVLSNPPKSEDQTPVLRMLRGAARGVSADAYRQHLDRKYR